MTKFRLSVPRLGNMLLPMLVLCIVSPSGFGEAVSYSPHAGSSYPTRVFWGDTHLHTTNSLDARLSGVSLDADAAYRFARGEPVLTSSGQVARLSRALDFLVVTDHSDALGSLDQLLSGNPSLLKHADLREFRERFLSGKITPEEMGVFVITLLGGEYEGPLLEPSLIQSVWERHIETADRYNQPGRFTALIGYEWTPTKGGDKLHRNVVYRGDAEKARQLFPFTAADSLNPQDLWKWMQRYEEQTGGKVLALAHNGNLSNGQMFPVSVNPETGGLIDKDYVKTRARWEPIYEVTQVKGDGETHPYLSPDDEFADFESLDRGNASLSVAKTPDMLQYEYAREALKNGLKLESTLNTNPYQFGMVGSTDSHTALSTADENNFFGKMALDEPRPGRVTTFLGGADLSNKYFQSLNSWKQTEMSASGYAAVWAEENTREAIWDAMKRREVYATTGPRITVRFFGAWDFETTLAQKPNLAMAGYRTGVPMGAVLPERKSPTSPRFLISALKDPDGANLDRVQIIKGWLDKSGNTHEKIYNVSWSDNRTIDKNGHLPVVGNTVNIEEASYTNSIGAVQLATVWRDPDFDPNVPAFYYARVLEIPTPRWPAFDVKRFASKAPAGTTMTLQERAYTSPIWYRP